VTLAAALALPTRFPFRDLILFTAFAVVLGTLVLQGMTLRPMMTWLQLGDDDTVEREVRLARVETLRAGLAMTDGKEGTDTTAFMRYRYEMLLRRAEAELEGEAADRGPGPTGASGVSPEDAETVRAATAAQRRRLTALRADGTIGDDAFQRLEQELDLAELDLQQVLRTE
jgi:CPA1 family monovalent cation:H+ antiporter